MDGKWINRPENGSSIVFVHGVLSQADVCWKHENGCYWPEIVADDPRLRGTGVYVYSYQTGIFSGTYRLSDIVDDLKERLRLDQVLNCKKVLFVCHSMGGIVVRKLLVERATDFIENDTEIGLFLLASPSLGSRYADILRAFAGVLGHAQAEALRFVENNQWLAELDKGFTNLKESKRVRLSGKELIEDKFIVLRRIFRTQVVEAFSGARYFGESYKVPNSTHFSIAKPADKNAIQHRLLLRFIAEMQIADLVDTIDSMDDVDTVDQLVKKHPVFRTAQSEIETTGISNAVAAALLSSGLPVASLSAFLLAMAKRSTGQRLFGIATCALELFDKVGAGESTLEYCLGEGRLEATWKESLGMRMPYLSNEDAVIWCHGRFVRDIRKDITYNSFLQRHIGTIVAKDGDHMLMYLLHPNRGPGGCNVDSFYLVMRYIGDSRSLVIRWKEWIVNGQFDGALSVGEESAGVLYAIFNDAVKNGIEECGVLMEATHQYVYSLLSTRDKGPRGLYHLYAMLSEKYIHAKVVYNGLSSRVFEWANIEEEIAYYALKQVFAAYIMFDGDRSPEGEAEFVKRFREAAVHVRSVRGVFR